MSRYAVGIDLGTTNSALAYSDSTSAAGDSPGPVDRLPIPQIVAISDVSERALLPSFLYLPAAKEFPSGALELPWKSPPDRVVGSFARDHGAKVPGRLVGSAKSWLSHQGVDRRARTHPAPGRAAEDVAKVSPVDASSAFLEHLRDTWNSRVAGKDDRRPPREPGSLPDRSRFVRPGGARADDRGGDEGGPQERHAARRAPGRLLRLARLPGRKVAQESQSRRRHPGLRRWRRDDRLHLDRRQRRSGRPRPLAAGGRRAHSPGRR